MNVLSRSLKSDISGACRRHASRLANQSSRPTSLTPSGSHPRWLLFNMTLDTLPPEILFTILSFATPDGVTAEHTPIHPWNSLAATNKHLNSIVEEYARGLLKQHADFTPPKSSKTFTCRKKWAEGICQMCKKSSRRRATLNRIFTCCRGCDRKHFPKMVRLQPNDFRNYAAIDSMRGQVLCSFLVGVLKT